MIAALAFGSRALGKTKYAQAAARRGIKTAIILTSTRINRPARQ